MFDMTSFFKKLEVLDHGYVELFDGMVNDPRLKIVNAARVSYKKSSTEYTDKDAKLAKFLYDHGHLSTYRHSYFSFRIKAPLFVFRQWWKYQVGSNWENEQELGDSIIINDTSWNEQSNRYVEIDPQFYIPSIVRAQSKINKQGSTMDNIEKIQIDGHDVDTKQLLIDSTKILYKTYNALVKAGVAKEIARTILPQNVYSECVWTCSLQTLIHFFNQRLKEDAQFEIREFAKATYNLIEPIFGTIITK